MKDERERTREDERQTRQLLAEAELLGRELQAAARAEKRAQAERERLGAGLSTADQTAQRARHAVAQAEAQENAARTALEESQRRHEAAHLRETLQVGDACPVCQASVREIPAAQTAGDDLKGLQAQLERDHQTTQQKRTAAQDAHAALTALRARLDDTESELEERGRARQEIQDRFVSRFPGQCVPVRSARCRTDAAKRAGRDAHRPGDAGRIRRAGQSAAVRPT